MSAVHALSLNTMSYINGSKFRIKLTIPSHRDVGSVAFRCHVRKRGEFTLVHEWVAMFVVIGPVDALATRLPAVVQSDRGVA